MASAQIERILFKERGLVMRIFHLFACLIGRHRRSQRKIRREGNRDMTRCRHCGIRMMKAGGEWRKAGRTVKEIFSREPQGASGADYVRWNRRRPLARHAAITNQSASTLMSIKPCAL